MSGKVKKMAHANPILDAEFSEIKNSMRPSGDAGQAPARSTKSTTEQGPITMRPLRAA